MAEIWGAAIIGGGALLGGVLSSNAAGNAAQDQENAANQANALQQNMYNQNVAREQPWVNTGQSATNALSSLYGLNGAAPNYSAFESSPQYQFALQQGTQAMDNSAAAKGTLFSGGYGKDMQSYGQGLASQQLGAYTSGLNQLATMGQNAASGVGYMGQNSANAQNANLMSSGGAAAAGTINSTNAWTGALNQLGMAGSSALGYQNTMPNYYGDLTSGDSSALASGVYGPGVSYSNGLGINMPTY